MSASGVVEKGDKRYPEALVGVVPEVKKLWYQGDWDQDIFKKCVAVVGSRAMTVYGRQVLGRLIPDLVARGYTTVSGFMYGIDMEVHRLTYLNGGRTIGVFGWGIEREIDIENRDLYQKLIDNGSLFMSEYEGKTEPQRFTFPQRNRIVAGLASDVIVVEGARGSGSMITANLSLQFGRRLWAVPGPVTSKVSEGTNGLIKQGIAEMLTLGDDILYSEKASIDRAKVDLDDVESKIVDLITTSGGVKIGEIGRHMGMGVGKCTGILTKLEMSGVVVKVGGGYIIR